MDLSNIDINNPDAVKALQSVLKAQGYYSGQIDGKWGGATTEAAAKFRDAQQKAATQAAEDRKAQASAEVAKAEAERAKARAAEVKGSAGTKLTEAATILGPYAAGMSGGSWFALDKTKKEVAKLADAVESGKINPGVAEKQLNKLLTPMSKTRSVAQFGVPALMFAGGKYTRDVIAPAFGEYREYGNAAANFENAIGIGSGLAMAKNLYNQGKKADPIDEARIRSAALSPESPRNPGGNGESGYGGSKAPYEPISHADRAKAAYKAAGGKGNVTKRQAIEWLETPGNVTKANRAAVVDALGQGAEKNLPNTLRILKGTGKYVIPALFAGAAADASYSGAKARGMSDIDASGNAAIDATAVGMGTGSGLYAANKLLPKVSTGLIAKVAAPVGVAYDAYQQATQDLPEDRPFTRRVNAMAQPSSVGNPGALMANTALGEFGAGSLDEHIANFMNYMQEQGTR